MSEKVEKGLFVNVDYTGTLSSGEVFDSSKDRQPLEVQIGSGGVIPGFESALMGMSLNESKTFTLQPEEAYGQRDESRTYDFPKSQLPDGLNPEVGQMLMLTNQDGQQMPATVDRIEAESVVFDLNHPLAGKALTFTVEVVGISNSPSQACAGCGGSCAADGTEGCC